MAILPMEQLHLCAMKRDRKHILELLQRRGIVEVRDAGGEDEVFSKMDTSNSQNLFKKTADTAREAVEILDKAKPPEGGGLAFLKGRTAVGVNRDSKFCGLREDVHKTAGRIVQLRREVAEHKGDIARVEASLEALSPWMDLPVPQTFGGTKKVAAFIGTLDGEWDLDTIMQRLGEAAPDLTSVHVDIISSDKSQCRLLVLALKKDAVKTEDALRSFGFARPPGASHHMPAEKERRLLEQKADAEEKIRNAEDEIFSYADMRDELLYLEDHMEMRAEKYAVLEKLKQSKHTFVLNGYLPKENGDALQKELHEKFDCAVELTQAEEPGGEVPVLIRNSWFTEPVESVLNAYSLPAKGEVDPTSIMAIFYYIMFGLMFSDAGYGLIMFGVCLFCLLRFKNMEPNWNKNIRLFMWCGLSTVIWGVVFSSYFGDVVDVVSSTFFGNKVSIPPLWFYPMEKPMLLLIFCLGIGLVHLTVGYIMKGITCARNKDFSGIIYDSVFPIIAWYPLVVILCGSEMFEGMAGFKVTLPEIATPVCLAVSVVGILGILFTGGRESKNWLKRILKGAYAIYNTLSGWLSDVLSYSRLLALGLATGVIAGVMNQLGSMVGKSVVGVIVFIIVFAVGQAMNFGINVLGAYVHSNRLEYVEFFGKFYDGGGQKFAPFGIHTKHFKIIEEETQT